MSYFSAMGSSWSGRRSENGRGLESVMHGVMQLISQCDSEYNNNSYSSMMYVLKVSSIHRGETKVS